MEKSRRKREWTIADLVGAGTWITKILKLNICRWRMGKRRELLIPILG
jgi:hypothetical protein